MGFSFNMEQLLLAGTGPEAVPMHQYKCAHCGKDSEMPKSKANTNINYCSALCKKQAGVKRGSWVSVKCKVCGRDYLAKKADAEIRQTCSHKCRGTLRAINNRKEAECATA